MSASSRFKFIGHALRGDGPFRPRVVYNGDGGAQDVGESYLVQYPRESTEKYARRNEVAFYSAPVMRACSRFVSHVSQKAVSREIAGDLYQVMAADIDGKGNQLDVFWQDFMVNARARGTMLLLVDMPQTLGATQAEQIATRRAPYWSPITPEQVKEFSINDSGSFDSVSFMGMYYGDGDPVDCTWTFTTEEWSAVGKDDKTLAGDSHSLGACPVLIYTEAGDYPCFGAFSPIADLSKRLFNLESELDEILRSQTFSILTMQIPDNSSAEQMRDAAKVAGETIGTSNLMAHSGSTPSFIAPPDGPAKIYMDRIKQLEDRIDEISLQVATPNQRESGVSMQMRFQVINAELARFSERMEDLERRAWDMSAKWLSLSGYPTAAWPRDFNISDVTQELDVLSDMQSTGMPDEVIRQQKKRVVSTQFDSLAEDDKSALLVVLDNEASAL